MDEFRKTLLAVLRIALPLLVSTGMFSLVLFTDRTLLLWYDGTAMSASMAGGNLFWAMVCLPVGIASMTGAMIAQYVGSKQPQNVGRLLWQSVWLSLLFVPLIALSIIYAKEIFQYTGQPPELLADEATYFKILMWGSLGIILETALSGFFSGTERTSIIMWASVASTLLNITLDYWLIFGALMIPPLGITGAAIASVASFWFKAIVYAIVLARPRWEQEYHLLRGFCFDGKLLAKLFYFGFPAGLHAVAESGSFAWIILSIGKLGDLPLRATTMAINFNMVAFIPLVGLQVATSVLVGRRLTEQGPKEAAQAVRASLAVALGYCIIWASIYLLIPDTIFSIYRAGGDVGANEESIALAKNLLFIVTAYLFFDALQVILAGALRGAGDTWFVLLAVIIASVGILGTGTIFSDRINALISIEPVYYWWGVMCAWVWSLGLALSIRYLSGKWRTMRMVESPMVVEKSKSLTLAKPD